jgi:hypothetical protein
LSGARKCNPRLRDASIPARLNQGVVPAMALAAPTELEARSETSNCLLCIIIITSTSVKKGAKYCYTEVVNHDGLRDGSKCLDIQIRIRKNINADVHIRILFFNGNVKWMYLYLVFHIFSIRIHIRIEQNCGLSDTIRK